MQGQLIADSVERSLRFVPRNSGSMVMAESLPSPADSPRSSTPETITDDSAARLDGLLEQYLDLLDQYTKLREELSKTFSNGFFSLAQAQRSSTLGAGRRYGQEYYDERMKAQRKVSWRADTNAEEVDCKILKLENKSDSKSTTGASQQTSSKKSNGEDTVDQDKEPQNKAKEDQSESSKIPAKTIKLKQDPAKRDPLTWFGILVPPALRQTQTHFAKATEDQIPALVTIASRLRMIESQIWTAREELGILSEYDDERLDTEVEPIKTTESTEKVKRTESTTDSSRTSRKPLASRPAHSKSHLLKLGD